MDSPLDRLRNTFDRASECLTEVAAAHAKDQNAIQWLESQLGAVVTELQIMLAGLDSGLSLGDIGIASTSEFEDVLEAFEAEISTLRERISVLRQHGLGR